MKLLALSVLLVASMTTGATSPAGNAKAPENVRVAEVCYKTGEQNQGQTKICYYDCGGAKFYQTVGYLEMCPAFINR